jgi:predicted  nucleic acid-binding Zn-ribbon protein
MTVAPTRRRCCRGRVSCLDAERDHDPEVAALSDRAAELTYQLVDLGADLAAYSTSVESDPARLAAVQERRAVLGALARQYGPEHDDVVAWSERAAMRVMELEGADDRIAALSEEREALSGQLLDLASRLSRARADAADRLASLGQHRAQRAVDAACPAGGRGAVPGAPSPSPTWARTAPTTSRCCWPPTPGQQRARSPREPVGVSSPG